MGPTNKEFVPPYRTLDLSQVSRESQAGSAVPDLGRPHDVIILELLFEKHLWDIVESHLQIRI